MKNNRKYSYTLFSVTIILLLSISAINIAVDPIGVFGFPVIEGFNNVKTDTSKISRLKNAFTVYTNKPNTIILGTSRAEYGIKCSHPSLANSICENLSLPAVEMYEVYRYLQHANNVRKLDKVIIGLDLMSFNQNSDNRNFFSEDWLSVSYDGKQQYTGYYTELVKLAISDQTLKGAKKTFKASRKNRGVNNKPIEQLPPFRFWTSIIYAYLKDLWYPGASSTFALKPANSPDSKLFMLHKIIDYAYQHNIKLYIYISPVHIWLMETMEARGLWDTFEQWKRGVVSVTESVADKHNRAPFKVWDFSGYNPITASHYPAMHETTLPKYFRDPAHFRPVVGDMILDRIILSKNSTTFEFGHEINSDNINNHLIQMRLSQSEYRKRDLALYNMISRYVDGYPEKWQDMKLIHP